MNAMTSQDLKDLLRSALRVLAIRDANTFNAKVAQIPPGLTDDNVDDETKLLLSEVEANRRLFRTEETVLAYARHLLVCQEPLKALTFLQECRPVGLENSNNLAALQARIEIGLRHLDDWDEYKHFYGVPYYYSTFDISTGTARGRRALEVAAGLQPDAAILSIGPNDGLLERRLLEKSPGVATLTVAELEWSFDEVLDVLVQDFPGRIDRHHMQDFYDWSPDIAYDLVVMFEVLEHLPDEHEAVSMLAHHTADDGVALVSVPVGKKYFEAHKADDIQYQHVRAFTEETLRKCLETWFTHVVITEGTDRTFVAECRRPKR